MVDINEKAFADATNTKKRKSIGEQLANSKDGKRHKTDSTKLDSDKQLGNIGKANKRQKKKRINRKMTAMDGTTTKANVARLPQSSTDMSSNWKKLLQQMEEENKKNGVPIKQKKCYSENNFYKKSSQPDVNGKHLDLEKNRKMDNKKSPEVWFDGVDKSLLDQNEDVAEVVIARDQLYKHKGDQNCAAKEDPLIKEKSFKGFTKAIAMDCEMVGVGYTGSESVLARVSLVNHFGHCVYDKYVKSREKVTDYRTAVSGIRPADIENANDFKEVQKEVSDILSNRILVGHAIRHDLKVLFLDHSKRMIRDTSTYKPFKALFGGRTPSLKNLSARMLGVTVQQGEHSSVQDAQAAMRLYTMFKKDWEKDSTKRNNKKTDSTNNQCFI